MPVCKDNSPSSSDVCDDTVDKVCAHTCFCQAPPKNVPQHYTPCCLPLGAPLSCREIQMFPEFRANLLRGKGEPPKTQTLRRWGQARARAHKKSFQDGTWIRVWRGQGHISTIGWLQITGWDEIKVCDIDHGDCVREGRPSWEPEHFRQKYCKGMAYNSKLLRIRFTFRACHACT
jgi:hypothetical protein